MTKNEATTQLRKAIIDHAIAHEICDVDSELLEDFAIIVSWTKVTETYPGTTHYTTHFSIQSMPTHLVLGLFQTGLEVSRPNYSND